MAWLMPESILCSSVPFGEMKNIQNLSESALVFLSQMSTPHIKHGNCLPGSHEVIYLKEVN